MKIALHLLGAEVVALAWGDDAMPVLEDHDLAGGQFELAPPPLGFTPAGPDDRARPSAYTKERVR